MALESLAGVRLDPPLNHNFLISLLDLNSAFGAIKSVAGTAVGGFSECTGLEMSMKVEEYNEGGNNGTVLKFPGRVSWSNIVLKKGLGRLDLWGWHYSFVQGKGKRRDGVITLLDEMRLPYTVWYFRRGLPTKYTGPSMNATANRVAVEAIEIAHEGIYQLPFAAVDAVQGALGL